MHIWVNLYLGIPRPLCSGNIPWSVYPTPVIKAEDTDDLDIWFRAAPDTPDGAGFKLLIVDYYDGCEYPTSRINAHLMFPSQNV